MDPEKDLEKDLFPQKQRERELEMGSERELEKEPSMELSREPLKELVTGSDH